MSSEGKSSESKKFNAKDFIADVRRVHQASRRRLSGRRIENNSLKSTATILPVPDDFLKPILELTDLVPVEDQILVFRRFEAMCHRLRLRLPNHLANAVLQHMVEDLAANVKLLKTRPRKLILATVCVGSMQRIYDRFPEFHHLPSVFRTAAKSSSNPEKYLENFRSSFNLMWVDGRLAELRETPTLFKRVALNRPKDPIGSMLATKAAVQRLENDERFVDFRDSPALLFRAAVEYPRNPDRFLLRLLDKVAELQNDSRFVSVRDQRSLFLRAVKTNPQEPDRHLLRALRLPSVRMRELPVPDRPDDALQKRAKALMNKVRKIQKKSGMPLKGRRNRISKPHLDPMNESFLQRLPENGHESYGIPWKDQAETYEMFLLMCYRRDVKIPDNLHQTIFCCLVDELFANSMVYSVIPSKLISATVYQGAVKDLSEEFPEFIGHTNLYKRALTQSPCDSTKWLRETRKMLDELQRQQRFQPLQDQPEYFIKAVVNHRTNPETYLLSILDKPKNESGPTPSLLNSKT